MERISLFTAVIDSALVSGAMGALLLILWRILGRQVPLLLWGLSQLAWALAMVLLAARGVVPDALSILIANASLVTSMVLLWAGMSWFMGRGTPLVAITIISSIYWITFPVLTYVIPDIAARIVIVRGLMIAGVLGALWSLCAPQNPSRRLVPGRNSRCAASVGIAPLLVTLALSAGVVIFNWNPEVPFFSHPVIIGSVLGCNVSMLIWGLVCLYLVIERRSRERETSAEMHRFLVDQTVAAMFMMQGNRLSYVNKAFCDLFGYTAEQLVDEMRVEDLAVPEERPRLLAALEQFREGQTVESHPCYRGVRANGSILHIEGHVRVLPGDGDLMIIGLLQDVTAQKQAHEQALQAKEQLEQEVALRTAELRQEVKTRARAEGEAKIFRLAIEQVDAAVLLLGSQGSILHVNSACQRMIASGDPAAAMTAGQPLNRSEPLQAAIMVAIAGDRLPWTGEVSLGDGKTVALTVSGLRRDDGSDIRAVAVATDISARVKISEHLAQAKLAAEQNSRSKSEFLANMSHELRTPLNAILGFSDMIKAEIWGPVGNEHYRGYAGDIHASASHLLTVINDVLDIAAVEQGTLALQEEWGSLCKILEGCLRLVAPRAQETGLSLSIDNQTGQPMDVYADQRRLRQIVLNLLSNAVKFTPSGGWVGVRIRQRHDGCLVISVYDSGIGMDEKGIVAALQRFGQVDSSLSRCWEGTGLGLPLANDLAAMHGAVLSVESAPGEGTTVNVLLPAERCRRTDPSGACAPEGDQRASAIDRIVG